VLRGVAALIYAIVVLARPPIMLGPLAETFGVYALADGIISGMGIPGVGRQWGAVAYLLTSISGIAAGMLTLSHPRITTTRLLLVMAGWALAIGIVELSTSFCLRRVIPWRWGFIYSSAVALIFGTTLAATLAVISVTSLTPIVPVIPMIGLFASTVGYLRLRSGLTMGVIALGAPSMTTQASVDAAHADRATH
jgi:uncharacterized membrane protein HdeD (DUF308 family)